MPPAMLLVRHEFATPVTVDREVTFEPLTPSCRGCGILRNANASTAQPESDSISAVTKRVLRITLQHS
jgi:hypothetical protein